MQFCFADCVLDVERRELLRAGLLVPVEPQVFDLLIYIVRNHDRVVGRDELIAAVWDGRIVSESTLTSRINAARRVIGDSGEAQRLIRTLSRKGVRFVGELAAPGIEATLRGSRPSIAVMPFENLSGDREQDYFADGMVEEIITGLSRIKWLFVISRNSSFSYRGRALDVKAIGQELGVRYLLEGTVRRAGENIRVTGQLVEVETAHNVWADRYEGSLSDIFALQDELTMNVISAVEPTLRRAEIERARRRRPDNLDAYDFYLRALPHASTAMPADADIAVALLERALELEPDYALAHGLLAWCHEQRYLRGGLGHDARTAACMHAHAAIQTGADDAMALAMGGFVIGALERDYDRALEALDRSIALSPSSALAFGFSATVRAWNGDYLTAIEHGHMGIRLGPYDPLIYLPCVGLAYAYYLSGNYSAAAEAAARAVSANPSFSVPRYLHAASLYRLGRADEAKDIAKVLLTLEPSFTVSGLVAGKITAVERMQSLAETLTDLGLPT